MTPPERTCDPLIEFAHPSMFRVTDYPLLVFAVSLTLLWLAIRIGAVLARRWKRDEDHKDDFNLVLSATLTLLGLIIAFTFSMAVGRYDQRKNLEAEEANAIGTEYMRATLLPGPDAARARSLLKEYTQQRILFYTADHPGAMPEVDARTLQLQKDMWTLVAAAAGAAPHPVMALIVSGMNDVLNSQGYAQAAAWNRIPRSAWILMLAISLLCHVLVGFRARNLQAERLLLLALPLAMAISFSLIADVDAPRRGLIRVEPKNLLSLAESLSSL
jgi:hypothetical protein